VITPRQYDKQISTPPILIPRAYCDFMRRLIGARSGPENLTASFKIDDQAIRQAFASDMNRRLQPEIQRAQELAAYGKNPIGWHGIPPVRMRSPRRARREGALFPWFQAFAVVCETGISSAGS
jgi:hypothetical protein